MHWHNVNSGSIQFTITWFLHSSPFMLIYMIRTLFNHKNLFIILSRTIKIKDNRLSINLLSSDASEYHRCDGVVFQVNITAILFLSFVDTAGVRCRCFYWKTFIAIVHFNEFKYFLYIPPRIINFNIVKLILYNFCNKRYVFFADFIFSYTISLLKKVQIVLNDIDENYGKLMSMH